MSQSTVNTTPGVNTRDSNKSQVNGNAVNFQEVERTRVIYAKRLFEECLGFCAITVVLGISLFAYGDLAALSSLAPFDFFVFIVFAIICSFVNRTVRHDYHNAYKVYFVEQNLRRVFTNLRYHHERGLSESFLSATGMINTGDRYSSNDFVSGEYKEVTFSQADVEIENKYTDSKGNTNYVAIFRGRFMVFEFPKRFNFKLLLAGRRFRAYRKPGKDKVTGRKAEKISTESSEFNRAFRIFGQDGFEAYYILDPAFMVKLLDIATQHKKKVLFAFSENRLIIGLDDGKDSFEPPFAIKKLDEAKESVKVATDIKIITDFVDQLSLDRKLFS